MSTATTTPPTPWPTVKLGDVCEASTGEELYAQIQAKKAELIKAGKLKKEKPLPSISSKEIPFKIPSTWKWVRLGEICTITTGKKDANFGDVNGKYLFFTCAKEPTRSNSYSFSGEAILLAGNGDIGNISYYVGEFEAYQRTYVLQPYFEFSYLIYILYHLRGHWVNYNAEKMFGSAMPYIRLGNIQNYPIPLPPLEVQREIVAKVEAGLKEADGLVAHFKRLAALADETFKAELDETFSTLNAPTVKLGNVCEVRAGQSPDGVHYTSDSSFVEFHQGCKAFGEKYLQTSNTYTKDVTKLASVGSIVMSVRAPVGTVNITQREICIGRGLCTFILSESLLRDYLYNYFLASREKLNDAAGAGSVFPSISRKQLMDIPIPLPPLEVQREIVAKLEAVKAQCERLKAEAERGLKAAEALRKAVLAEAFEQ